MSEPTAELIEQLREVTREAHGAIRDLTRIKREIDEQIASIPGRVTKCMEDSLNAAMDEGREGLHESFLRSTRDAEQAIFERFHRISSILMGKPDSEASMETKAAKLRKLFLRYDIQPAIVLMRNGDLPSNFRDLVALRDVRDTLR